MCVWILLEKQNTILKAFSILSLPTSSSSAPSYYLIYPLDWNLLTIASPITSNKIKYDTRDITEISIT